MAATPPRRRWRAMRKVVLWGGIVAATVVLAVVAPLTALWMSVGGVWFRGERATVATFVQIALAVLSCVGLAFLIRKMFKAAKRPRA